METYPCHPRIINIFNYIQPKFILSIDLNKTIYSGNDELSGILKTEENGIGDIKVDNCEIVAKFNDNQEKVYIYNNKIIEN